MVSENIFKNVQAIFPKDKSSELVNVLERLGGRFTDFIRGNPIVSTAAIGIGVTGLTAAAITRVKKRRKKKVARKVGRKKRVTTRRRKGKKKTQVQIRRMRLRNLAKARRARRTGKRRTHRSPRHKGHKRVSFTTASGQKVNFLVGKKGSPSHRKKRRKR